MRQSLRVSSSFLASLSLALGVVAATVAIAGTAAAQDDPPPQEPLFCGPPIYHPDLGQWDCRQPTICWAPRVCAPVTVVIEGENFVQCKCL